MSRFRLIVVHTDGIHHSSDFSGWHAETATYRCFNEAKEDKRVSAALVFHSAVEGGPFYLKANYTASETK